MKSMGIRVTPTIIYYTVIDTDDMSISIENLIVPKSLPIAGKLRFIRTNIQSIIMEFGITNVGIRTAEHNARKLDSFRLNIEGVIMELISNTFVNNYFAGTISQMAAKLSMGSHELKNCITNLDSRSIALPENIATKKEEFESCCVAVAASKCKGGLL